MNKTETIQIVTLLAGNYDSIANKDKAQKQLMVATWQECLGDLEYDLVLQAVKRTIIESPYPPTIHEIRKNAIEIINPNNNKTAIEAWDEALKMISRGLYMTEEEFDSHSPEIKKFFGSVNQVRQQAMVDIETINTVTKGQFLKQYEFLTENNNKEKLLPEQMKKTLDLLSNNMDVNRLLGDSK